MPVQLSGAVLKGAQVNSASPAALFAAGEQGVWFDPSDMSTMFQDSAGSIPVTSYEQPVGLMLDKSKGLVIGNELVTNGDFSNGSTNWYLSAGWSVSNGRASASMTVGGPIYQIIPSIQIGNWYVVSFDIISTSGDTLRLGALGSGTNWFFYSPGATGRKTVYVRALSTQIDVDAYGGTTAVIDNISVRAISGNHAFQTTAASRPVLSARYNLLTNTENFSNAAWTNVSNQITIATGITTPSGISLQKLTNNGTVNVFLYQSPTITSSSSFTLSAIAKYGDAPYMVIFLSSGSNGIRKGFNIQNGTIGSTQTIGAGWNITDASITNIGNEFYLCKITVTSPTISTINVGTHPALDVDNTITGTIGKFNYLGAVDFRVANDGVGLPNYQRVGAAVAGSSTTAGTADYDTAGFPPYLRFDGVDDSLQTSSIDMTGTDKINMFTGIRKLSDSGLGIFLEFGSSWDITGGAGLYYSGTSYVHGVQGTSFNYRTYSTFSSPLTNTVYTYYTTNAANSSSAIITRFNNVQNDGVNSGSNISTGNFGNYSLNIGRRNNTSFPFNGRLYQLIIRGTQTSQSLIDAIETWTNLKTRAY